MVHSISRRLAPCALPIALLVAAVTAQAQTAARAVRADPLDPKASVPALTYESSFSRYRRLGDEKPVSWREANDTVARIGGWRVYAREAQQPDPAPAAKPAEPTPVTAPTGKDAAMPAGHGGGHKAP